MSETLTVLQKGPAGGLGFSFENSNLAILAQELLYITWVAAVADVPVGFGSSFGS